MEYQNFIRGNQNNLGYNNYYNNYAGYPGQTAYGQNNAYYADQYYNGYIGNNNYIGYNLGSHPNNLGSDSGGNNDDNNGSNSGNEPSASLGLPLTVTPQNWWQTLVPKQKWLKSSLDEPPGNPHAGHEIIAQFCPPQKLSALHQIANHWAAIDGKPKFVSKSLYWYTDDIVEVVDDGVPTPIPVLHPGIDDQFSAMDPNNAVFYGDDGKLIPYGRQGYTSNTITVKNMDKVESITFSIYGFYPNIINIPTVFEVIKTGTDYVVAQTENVPEVSAYCLDRPVVIKTFTRQEIMENQELFNINYLNRANQFTFEFRLRRFITPNPNSRIAPRAHLRRAKGTMGVNVTYKVEDLPK